MLVKTIGEYLLFPITIAGRIAADVCAFRTAAHVELPAALALTVKVAVGVKEYLSLAADLHFNLLVAILGTAPSTLKNKMRHARFVTIQYLKN
ncbi:hypothetical protein DPMN_101221 [Dreissena polymorpha]|uniref:Uncharacterized protein n=1 Tax=Dreissena polymorpha TaxID=45954 RepID=A0A9D4LHA5_DREPO|nr:hypothetical protein DPMN_101221 [Dreissena polymorpha]